MSKTIRSPIFCVELVLIAAPITFLAVLVGFVALSLDRGLVAAALILSYVGLFGFWGVSFRFLFDGVDGAMNAHPALWVATIAGALLALSSPIAFLLFPSSSSEVQNFFGVAACGIPLLLPLAHILLCILVKRANNSFKPKPLRGSA
jgi:hypothetical protein